MLGHLIATSKPPASPRGRRDQGGARQGRSPPGPILPQPLDAIGGLLNRPGPPLPSPQTRPRTGATGQVAESEIRHEI